jgi:hypothetical protein
MIRIRFNGKRNAPRDLGFTVDEFLTRVAAVVRVSGEYVTKRQADERNEREGYPVDEPFYLSTAKSATRVNTATLNVTDADRAFAAEAYQHVAALPVEARAKSEFLSDLYAAVQNGVVNARTAGTIAFAVELLRRDRERAAKAETSATPCDASRIVTMLAGAREKGLKFPKIRLQVNGRVEVREELALGAGLDGERGNVLVGLGREGAVGVGHVEGRGVDARRRLGGRQVERLVDRVALALVALVGLTLGDVLTRHADDGSDAGEELVDGEAEVAGGVALAVETNADHVVSLLLRAGNRSQQKTHYPAARPESTHLEEIFHPASFFFTFEISSSTSCSKTLISRPIVRRESTITLPRARSSRI